MASALFNLRIDFDAIGKLPCWRINIVIRIFCFAFTRSRTDALRHGYLSGRLPPLVSYF